MSGFHQYSRVNNRQKRRKHQRAILFLMSFATCLVVLFVFFTFVFNKEEQETANHTSAQNDQRIQEANDEQVETNEVDLETSENGLLGSETNGHVDTNNENEDEVNYGSEEDELILEETDDELVIESYSGHWEPVGTIQAEPHVTQYNQESQDWQEMEQAIRYATGLEEMIT